MGNSLKRSSYDGPKNDYGQRRRGSRRLSTSSGDGPIDDFRQKERRKRRDRLLSTSSGDAGISITIDENTITPVKPSLFIRGRGRIRRRTEGDYLYNNFDKVQTVPTSFQYEGPAEKVHIKFSSDEWKIARPLQKSKSGNFYAVINLPIGIHSYKIFVDGECKLDPRNPDTDESQTMNFINIERSDLEVFEALAVDRSTAAIRDASPPYSQEIPPRPPSSMYSEGGPPILPAVGGLQESLLNKKYFDPDEKPNALPIDHAYIYNQCVKDNEVVLSSTHRYRDKFTTLIFYAPVTATNDLKTEN